MKSLHRALDDYLEDLRSLQYSPATRRQAGYRTRTMLELLYSGGVRVAELLGLDVDRIDLRAATALVTGKGRKERVVPIGRTALRYLETYLRAVRPYLAADPEQKAVFLDDAGKRMPYHSFRRSCATELIRGGANMYHVKELLRGTRAPSMPGFSWCWAIMKMGDNTLCGLVLSTP